MPGWGCIAELYDNIGISELLRRQGLNGHQDRRLFCLFLVLHRKRRLDIHLSSALAAEEGVIVKRLLLSALRCELDDTIILLFNDVIRADDRCVNSFVASWRIKMFWFATVMSLLLVVFPSFSFDIGPCIW